MTREDYKRFETNVAEFIAREGITFLSTSTAETCGGEESEPWYSGSTCECCGDTDGGSREYLYARDASNAIVRFEVCENCVYYIAYGRLDDLTMLELERKVAG